ncbi:MAG TPA: signal peptide peptidase SppA [Sedimentisphaerales bacterium]|nr:signal peptide peptidase SppA [Sedimentisphaerales bacterium]
MNTEENNFGVTEQSPSAQEAAFVAGSEFTEAGRKKRSGWRIFWIVFTVLSVLANIFLFLALIGFGAMFVAGQRGIFTEEVLIEGPRTAKIAVVGIEGVIDDRCFEDFSRRLKSAQKDERVKGVIVKINSPGGMVSASDRIYNQIVQYQQQTQKPAVALMEGMAASGGYYTSVACREIIAEPTTITGSIGVIMGHFVLEKLFEEKLGIKPVIIKAGEKKDWPSSFEEPTEEQKEYIQERLIRPAYERFVEVVAEGRESLTIDDVRRLADGSIYGADRALEEKMIDGIGYLDSAVERVLSLAGIEKAQVIEYRRPFSFWSVFGLSGQSLLSIDKASLYELSMPELLYLWRAY